jgi:uncharacterized phage infection (PIP) family protein YhgE
LRARVFEQGQAWIGWTEAARRADPVGFTDHVERELKEDLDKLQAARGQLAGEIGTLSRNVREQQALLEHAEKLAAEFRDVYQAATEDGTFPVTVRDAAYTEDQAVSQVSLLLAETEGYRETLSKVEALRKQAESRLEELTVRVDRTASQLAMIATKRELLRARVLTDEAEQLVTQVDELLDGNTQIVQDNPVRSVEELLAASQGRSSRPSLEQARQFLVTKPTAQDVESIAVNATQEPVVSLKPQLEERAPKPIFQQN